MKKEKKMGELIAFGDFYKTEVYCLGEVYIATFAWVFGEGDIFCQKCKQRASRVVVTRVIGIIDNNGSSIDPRTGIGKKILKNLQAELDDHSDLYYFPKDKLAKPPCRCKEKYQERFNGSKSEEDQYDPQYGQPKA